MTYSFEFEFEFENPVIRGFYPDPSVCRVGERFYLVTSSFHYFPGVPLFESSDLVNWKQIGHCLTRESQLPLEGCHTSGGIFAPTIRHNSLNGKGRFYMTTTNVTAGGNFYVFTDDIYGEWSEPIWVEQEGIDPSLYFEGEKAYFMSNGHDSQGKPAILQSEIDIETGKLLSETRALWGGTGGRYLESPHLYKIGEWYYLTAAEGGTEYGHMVTYARSKDLWGQYESYRGNPVLTNRDLGGYPIQGIGHADLVDDADGNWWIFHLGFRQISKWEPFHHLGRETFLMPVDFGEDGWFSIPGGVTTETVTTDRITATQESDYSLTEHDWIYLRRFEQDKYERGEGGVIRIKSGGFTAVRQREFDMDVSVTVKVKDGEAGLTVYMDENHHYDLVVGNGEVKLMLCIGDNIKHCMSSIECGCEASLQIVSDAINYTFFANGKQLGKAQTRYLSSEVACGFTGVVVGLYSQNGKSDNFNEFIGFNLSYS
jgi:alpha-N-arabinofuranosidase